MKLDRLTVQTVSPSLGKSSLQAGLISGLAGLALVMLYMIFYYRLLGMVVVAGLAVTGALLWAIIALLGQGFNTTIDLAGVIGIIVSIGITVDSYIVYFERLKDEARSGRTVRTSVDKGFASAFRTVLAADAVSLLGAVVLYEFSIGAVQGFALFLGHLHPPRRLRHLLLHPAVRDPPRAAAERQRRPGHERGQRPGRDRGGDSVSARRARRRQRHGAPADDAAGSVNGRPELPRRTRRPSSSRRRSTRSSSSPPRRRSARSGARSATTSSSASTGARPRSTSSATADGGSASRP